MARRKRRRTSIARTGGASLAKVRKYEKQLTRLKASTAAARKKTGLFVEQIMNTAVTAGTGFGLGFWTAKNRGMPSIGPVPADAGIAIGAHLLAVLGVGGKMESHLRALGDGALATFAVRAGTRLGGTGQVVSPTTPTAAGADFAGGQYDWANSVQGQYDDDDDEDEDELEGMALDPTDFAGVEIL